MTFLQYINSARFIESLMVLILTMFLLYIIKQFLIKKVAYTTKAEQHQNTFLGVIFNLLQYAVIIIAVVIILQLHGINVRSILAGLGIMATIIGLALQDTLKDIISGINIYSNNFYKVGDMVRWNGEECDVKYFSARVTKFQSVFTNSTYTVCNSMINQIEKIKDTRFRTFRFKFEEDRELIDKAFAKVTERMKKECKNLKEIISLGPINITYEGVEFGLLYKCPAHKFLEVDMMLIGECYKAFKEVGIMPDQNSFSVDTTKIK